VISVVNAFDKVDPPSRVNRDATNFMTFMFFMVKLAFDSDFPVFSVFPVVNAFLF